MIYKSLRRLLPVLLLVAGCSAQQAPVSSVRGAPTGTANQVAVNGNTVSLPSIVQFPGSYAGPQRGSNEAAVDTVVNTSLAGALLSSPCFGSNLGCNVFADRQEIFHISLPLSGARNYEIKLTHSNPGGSNTPNWWLTKPLVISSDQIIGSGRASYSGDNGSTGTIIQACDGDTNCGGLYFPNAPPVPPTGSGTPSGSGGSLATNTYYEEHVFLTNLYTAYDSTATASDSAWAGTTGYFAGQFVTDATTNCGGSACTEVVITAGTSGGSTPSWSSSSGGKTTDGTVTWENVGNLVTANTYGAPGLSYLSTETSSGVTGPTGSIAYAAITVPAYPNCSQSGVAYGTTAQNQYVLGPFGVNSHLYRAVGSGTTTGSSCNMSTAAGSQTQDGGASGLYWQEVGSPTNYLSVAGFIPFVGIASGGESAQCTVAGGCNGTCSLGTVQVGDKLACVIGSTFTLTSYAATSFLLPQIETADAEVVMGMAQNNVTSTPSFFDTEIGHLTIHTGNIAGEGLLNLYSQENSKPSTLNIIGGHEVPVAFIGPGAQNSGIDDIHVTNPAGNPPYWFSRVAGCIFLDVRSGAAMKRAGQVSCTPYSNPAGSSVPYDIYSLGTTDGDWTGLHAENATSGKFVNGTGGTNLAIDFLMDLNCTSTDTNCYEFGANTNAIFANVNPAGASVSVKDDVNSVTYTGSGTFMLGNSDSRSNRPQLGTFVGQPWLNDGGMTFAPTSTSVVPVLINAVNGTSVNVFTAQINAVTKFFISSAGVLTSGSTAAVDFSNITAAAGFKVPVQAGAVAGADGVIDYDSTNKNTHIRSNGGDAVAIAQVCKTSQKSETGSADANVLTCTPASIAGTYRISVSISVSAATSGVIGWTATWTDSNGNAQAPTELEMFQNGTAAPALTFTTSAAGNYHASVPVDVNNAGTAIVVKWIGGGTTTAKMSAVIEKVI